MRQKLITFAAVLAVAAVPSAQTPPQTPPQAPEQRTSTIIQKIIVKVNGEILTQTDLEQRQIDAVRALPNIAQITTNAQLETAITDVTPGVLVQAVDDMLLLARGKELGFRLSAEQFDQIVENAKSQNNLDDEQLLQVLAQEGMTLEGYRQSMERQLIINQVQSQEVLDTTSLTEAEMRQYYAANPDEFTLPATVTIREVFVPAPTRTQSGEAVMNVGEDEAARAKITAARERLLAGEDAATVIAEVSESPSKANGGLIGPVVLDDMAPALSAAVRDLAEGEVSEPVRNQNGYQIFVMDTRSDSTVAPFEDVRDEIQQGIYRQRVEAEMDDYLERMMAQAVIEWKDDTYQRLYEQGRAAAAQAQDGGEQ